MQMVCVHEGPWTYIIVKKGLFSTKRTQITVPGPKKGDVVNITDTNYTEEGSYYKVEEWTPFTRATYKSKYFMKLDEVEEEYVEVETSKIAEKVALSSAN